MLRNFFQTLPTVQELEDITNYKKFEGDGELKIGSGPYYVIEIDPNNNEKVVNYGNYEGIDNTKDKSSEPMPNEKICKFTNKKKVLVECDLKFYKKIQTTTTAGKKYKKSRKTKKSKKRRTSKKR